MFQTNFGQKNIFQKFLVIFFGSANFLCTKKDVALMSKLIALYQNKDYFSYAILFKLGRLSYLVRLVSFLG